MDSSASKACAKVFSSPISVLEISHSDMNSHNEIQKPEPIIDIQRLDLETFIDQDGTPSTFEQYSKSLEGLDDFVSLSTILQIFIVFFFVSNQLSKRFVIVVL